MRVKVHRQLSIIVLLVIAHTAAAQTGTAPTAIAPVASPAATPAVEAAAPAQAVPAAPGTTASAARTLVLRANSLIPLRFTETVGSDVSKPGALFHMQVTDDINVDDAVLIPAGSVAVGEVIDSQPARAFGKAGKLIVSARYILVGERQIKLHSMLGNAGRSLVVAALFVPFIHGQQADIPADTEVVAKTANNESFDVPPTAAH
jgi:hypothetical protein